MWGNFKVLLKSSSPTKKALNVLLLLGGAVPVVLLLGRTVWGGFDVDGMKLPPGFVVTTYVTGTGFDPNRSQNGRGIPAIVAFTFDREGTLYSARTANRLWEIYGRDTASIYRIPPGGAKITPQTESSFLFGPPLADPDEVAVNAKGEVFVSSSDRAREYGTVFRLTSSGRATLFAGGPPTSGNPPLLKDPEGIAFDQSGNAYVVDVDLGVVVRVDPDGKVLNPRFLTGIGRGRTLTFDPRGYLWIGSDGPHDTPHQDGSGRIYRALLPEGKVSLVHTGPLPSGMSLSPGGNLWVAQRRSGKLFALTPEGKRVEFASFTGESALRTLGFAPVTQETKQAGIAGDLFVMVFPMLDYPVREVIRISGPFDSYIEETRRGR
jgi:sugar lactone lactonase YvrE